MNAKLAEFLHVFFGFRKMLILLILFSVGIIFRLNNLISGSEMVDLMKTTAIAFMGANGISKIVAVAREHISSKNPPQDKDAPPEEEKGVEFTE